MNSAPVLLSFATCNPGDARQILSGVAAGGYSRLQEFEDLPIATGDNDFQNIVFGIRVSTDNDLLL